MAPVPIPTSLFRAPGLRRLLPYILANWQRLLLGVLCALAATSITYLTVKMFGLFADASNGIHFDPNLIQQIRDGIQLHQHADPALVQQLLSKIVQAVPDQRAVDRDASWLALLFLAKGIFSYGQSYLVSSASQKVLLRLRNEVYAHLQQMGLRFFDRRKTGQLMAAITADIPQIQNAVGQNIIDSINAPFTIVAGVIYIIVLNWKLALLSAVAIPVMSVLIGAARRRMRRATHLMQTALADISDRLEESLTCIRVIKAFVTEEAETLRFMRASSDSYRGYMRGVRITAALRPLVELIGALGITMAMWVGERQITADPRHFTLGSLLQFVGAVHYIAQAFGGLGGLTLGFQQANVAAERIFSLLDECPDVQDEPNAAALKTLEGSIEFRQVDFSYGQEPVLKAVSFKVRPGEALAIVGPSGAGKSTIANLVPRFYDVDSGAILVDGQDVKHVTAASLRRQIGIVPQESVLFAVSLRENIAYGSPDATEEEVREAARAANALEFIESLPEGLDTVVGQRGATLSGGQRQRIAIARAIMRNPRILVLDEATSSLDSQSEAIVQAALEKLMKGRTTVMIAHRLSTVRKADRILVLNGGKVVEEGRHQELMDRRGLYAELYQRQMQAHSPTVIKIETESASSLAVPGAAVGSHGG